MNPNNHTTAAAIKATILRIGVPCAQRMKKSPSAKITIKPADNCCQPVKDGTYRQFAFVR